MTDGIPTPAPPRFFPVAWLVGALRGQRLMWAEAFSQWLRRPLPSVPYSLQLGEGRRFELRRGSWMSVLVPMVVFSQLVDVLIAQGAIHVIAAGPRRLALHALLLFGSLWAVVWAVSLRSATRHVEHVLGARTLTLAIGFKHQCRVPLTAIADVQRRVDHDHHRHGLHRRRPDGVRALRAQRHAAGRWPRGRRLRDVLVKSLRRS